MNGKIGAIVTTMKEVRKQLIEYFYLPRKYSEAASFYKVFKVSKPHKRSYTLPAGTPGSGAGKGGGAGGSIKESGGGLGRFGAAQEEGYFYNKGREQLQKLKQKGNESPKPKKSGDEKPRS